MDRKRSSGSEPDRREVASADPAETDRAHMLRALALAAEAAASGEVPVGAVLVGPDGEVLSEGSNGPIGSNDPTAHAEILALRGAAQRVSNYRLPGTTLYVTLEPCPMCAGAIVHARVARLVFAAADPKSGACGSVMDIVRDARLNHRVRVESGLLEPQAAEQLKAFFQARR
ncbi:MAG TPA: tRNA adenosine(34) deaminase TadA [Gammaproteobacteria bacterium]|nr:tRNA adenosine(34) deaminase TadA [Gammaproteobacteria bacterium]